MGLLLKKSVITSDVLTHCVIKMQNRELPLGQWNDFVHGPVNVYCEVRGASEAENVPSKKTSCILPPSHSALSQHHRLELLLLDSVGTEVCGWCVSTNKPNFLSGVQSRF